MQHATSGRWQVPPLKRQFDALDARVAAITTDSDGVRREWGAKVEALYALVVDQGRSHADAKRLLSSQLESAGAVAQYLLCSALLCSAVCAGMHLRHHGHLVGRMAWFPGLRRSLARVSLQVSISEMFPTRPPRISSRSANCRPRSVALAHPFGPA